MKLSRRRKALFACLTLVALGVLFEGISYLTATLLEGQPFSYERYATRRAQVVGDQERAEVVHVGPDPAREIGAANITTGREVLHPYLGFVFNPELNELEQREERGELLITPQGFFRSPQAPERSDDDVRIGIFGGSVALLFAFDGGPRLSELLAAAPQFADRRVSIECLALGGYKQPQQLLTLTYLLTLGERFDVVINIDGFNELALGTFDNYRHGVYPFYPRAWKQRVDLIPDRERQVQIARLAMVRHHRARLARRISGILEHSVTVNLLWSLLDRRLANRLVREQIILAEMPTAQHTYQWQGPFTPQPTDDELFTELTRQWRDSSQQMHHLSRANGARYLHVLQPNQYLPGSKPMDRAERLVAIDANSPYRGPAEAGYPLLIEAGAELRREGVAFLDASRLFADVEESLYVDSCCHFNRRGNEILAEAIASAILDLD